jgi:hypothetical protein
MLYSQFSKHSFVAAYIYCCHYRQDPDLEHLETAIKYCQPEDELVSNQIFNQVIEDQG